ATTKPTSGHATFDLVCPAGADTSCAGTVAVMTKGAKPSRLLRGSFTMPAGDGARESLSVSGALFKSLARTHSLKVLVTTVAHDAGGHHATKSVTVTLTYAATG
ncbi:MAG: hypothetical protein ACRDV0_08865, partial [Acidimicrobiales bacterium]